jgi:hypothetical protein
LQAHKARRRKEKKYFWPKIIANTEMLSSHQFQIDDFKYFMKISFISWSIIDSVALKCGRCKVEVKVRREIFFSIVGGKYDKCRIM